MFGVHFLKGQQIVSNMFKSLRKILIHYLETGIILPVTNYQFLTQID